jgi:tetratricopeptide (TPR) repeat protein
MRNPGPLVKGKAMPRGQSRHPWHGIVFAAAISALACHAAYAKDAAASAKEAEEYVAKGNLRAAEIELRNAIREAPQDPVLHARLAAVYLQLGEVASAEREARSARERNGNEADYLPALADSLLRQEKFADLLDLVQPGNRNPALESKVRTALGTAAAGLRDRAKSEALLRQAIELDPGTLRPKIQLARLLAGTKPEEANKLLDEAIAANPTSTEALQVKGEMLRSRGDLEGALRLFDQALKINPKDAAAHLSRAAALIMQGKFKAADDDLDPILKASPNNFMANYLRGFELAKQQQYAAADRIFERISPGFATFWSGYYLQGATKYQLGQYAQAEALLTKYLSRAPTT